MAVLHVALLAVAPGGPFLSRVLSCACAMLHSCISGSFAVVKRAVRKSDGKQFAIKVIKKSKLNSEELAVVHDEVEIMHKVRNTRTAHGRVVWRRRGRCDVLGLAAVECWSHC